MADVPEERVIDVAEMFGEVARQLADEHDPQATLDKIVELASQSLDACECAGISAVEGTTVTSPASTGDMAVVADRIQAETGEGPCVDVLKEHEMFQTGNLERETRWPRFASRAHEETGVSSILAARLFIEQDTLASLNLYSTDVDAFDDTDVALATVFAAHAAVAMTTARREEALERKASTRDIIGIAKGILMARQGVTAEHAFELLVKASQRANVKLVKIAEHVAYTGDSPSGAH